MGLVSLRFACDVGKRVVARVGAGAQVGKCWNVNNEGAVEAVDDIYTSSSLVRYSDILLGKTTVACSQNSIWSFKIH